MARTLVDLDEKLLKEAMKLSGIKVKVALVNMGLEALVKSLRRKEILKSIGNVEGDWDIDRWRGRVRR